MKAIALLERYEALHPERVRCEACDFDYGMAYGVALIIELPSQTSPRLREKPIRRAIKFRGRWLGDRPLLYVLGRRKLARLIHRKLKRALR